MILETTYTSREVTLQINGIVGEPYSLLERLKMGGIGSKRMPIAAISDEYQEYLKAAHYKTYANIELRPKGIIIHFRYKLESYAWPIAFHALSIETKPDLILQSEGKFISFEEGIKLNSAFIEKLLMRSKTV
ncbi:MAG: hypothetical protein ABJ004_04510 [Cyclobacteriaceae bacterium]